MRECLEDQRLLLMNLLPVELRKIARGEAVFADFGVTLIAVINALRVMKTNYVFLIFIVITLLIADFS